MGLDRFSFRGKKKVNTQWRVIPPFLMEFKSRKIYHLIKTVFVFLPFTKREGRKIKTVSCRCF